MNIKNKKIRSFSGGRARIWIWQVGCLVGKTEYLAYRSEYLFCASKFVELRLIRSRGYDIRVVRAQIVTRSARTPWKTPTVKRDNTGTYSIILLQNMNNC